MYLLHIPADHPKAGWYSASPREALRLVTAGAANAALQCTELQSLLQGASAPVTLLNHCIAVTCRTARAHFLPLDDRFARRDLSVVLASTRAAMAFGERGGGFRGGRGGGRGGDRGGRGGRG